MDRYIETQESKDHWTPRSVFFLFEIVISSNGSQVKQVELKMNKKDLRGNKERRLQIYLELLPRTI